MKAKAKASTSPSPKAAMTNHVARLYSFAAAILVFLLTWVAVSAHPWRAARAEAKDPRMAALATREQRLRREAAQVQRIVDQRWARYRHALAKRKKEIAAAKARQQAMTVAASSPSFGAPPSVRVVSLPPLTVTKTS
jgi:hypothetical protein